MYMYLHDFQKNLEEKNPTRNNLWNYCNTCIEKIFWIDDKNA